MVESVASGLQSVAASLEHYGGAVATDSSSHHCWFFPPGGDWLECSEEEWRGEGDGGGGGGGEGGWGGRGGGVGGGGGKEGGGGGGGGGGRRNVSGRQKTCGCGCVKLADLPQNCAWSPLGSIGHASFVPDLIQRFAAAALGGVSMATGDQANVPEHGWRDSCPVVCDFFLPKLRAIEATNDLSSTILRVAVSISDK